MDGFAIYDKNVLTLSFGEHFCHFWLSLLSEIFTHPPILSDDVKRTELETRLLKKANVREKKYQNTLPVSVPISIWIGTIHGCPLLLIGTLSKDDDDGSDWTSVKK